MRIGVVVNPASGGTDKRGLWPAVRAELDRKGVRLEFSETVADGDAARFARLMASDGFDLVLAVGGDGTIGQVADGILRSAHPDTGFSFVPAVAGSDFARNFALPDTPVAYADLLLSAPARRLDVGSMTCEGEDGRPLTRHFVNVASLGVSARIARAANRGHDRRLMPDGPVPLCRSMVQILRYRPRSIRLRLDGIAIYEGPVTAVAVSNGRWFGGGRQVAPDAGTGDGLFDVVVIRGAPRLPVLRVMNSLYRGGHIESPLASIHRARRVEVVPAGRSAEPVARIEVDGEATGRVPARFDILPAALNLKI